MTKNGGAPGMNTVDGQGFVEHAAVIVMLLRTTIFSTSLTNSSRSRVVRSVQS